MIYQQIHEYHVKGNFIVTIDVPTSSSSTLSTSSNSVGKGVSLLNNGAAQLGAGTSIFRNISSISAVCPSYLSMDAVYESVYLISYGSSYDSGSTQYSTLEVVQVPQSNEATVVQKIASQYSFYEIVTLSMKDG